MTPQLLWCEDGQHLWLREPTAREWPRSCWEHRPSPLAAYAEQQLWCEAGQHPWTQPAGTRQRPRNCPEHANSEARMTTRWLGDLRTCFLLEDGWAFRQEVSRFLLDGRGGWRIPIAFAQHVGLADGEDREIRLQGSEQTLTLIRRAGHCSGSPIGGPLNELHADDGDLLFLQVRGARGSLLLRRRSELSEADALSQLLWYCGLDPTDEAVQREPWPRLGRVLGGSAAGREEVRHRLMRRGDEKLLALLEQSHSFSRRGRADDTSWPYTGQLAHDTAGMLVVEGSDGRRRVLLGVLDASNQPPRELVLTDGGLLWTEDTGSGPPIDRYLGAPPLGLVPAARRSGWRRWLRAEHRLRLAALSGVDWRVKRRQERWTVQNGTAAASLIDALEIAVDDVAAADRPPVSRVRTPYPRTTGAFRGLVEDAIDQGLRSLTADPESGLRAEYSDAEVPAASLHECLTLPV